MTVVAGWTAGYDVWMAADSAATNGEGEVCEERRKIMRLAVGGEGRFVGSRGFLPGWAPHALLAVSGFASLKEATRRHLRVAEAPDPHDDADCDGWAQAIAEAITGLAVDAEPSLVEDGRVSMHGLLGWCGRLWVLTENYAVPAVHGFTAVGSGGEYAAGYLAACREHDRLGGPEEQVVAAAARVACLWHADCKEPVVVDSAQLVPHPRYGERPA